MPANRMAALRLLSKLQDPNLTTDDLEETLSQDVALSYKLIRYVNSAMHSLPNDVSSIRHAIVLVGTRRISNWAGLILYGQMDDKPGELMITAIVRARMCQHVALATKQQNAEQFFTVGLFSVLDALLDRPMPEALAMLPLAPELKAALVDRQGLMGAALQSVMGYEVGNWDQAECAGISPETLYDSYVSALEWTRKTMKELGLEPNLHGQESLQRRSEAKLKLHRFASEQEQQVKQIDDEARKKVTRDLLARFDVEFEKLSLEYEERHKQAIAKAESAAEQRFKQAVAGAELAHEELKRDYESATRLWETERRQLMEAETSAKLAAQSTSEDWRGLETMISETRRERDELAGRLRTLEEVKTDLESQVQQLNSKPPVVQVAPPVASSGAPRGEGVASEITRVEAAITEISNQIESPATDLAAQIRLNRERSEMEAYLRGLQY